MNIKYRKNFVSLIAGVFATGVLIQSVEAQQQKKATEVYELGDTI